MPDTIKVHIFFKLLAWRKGEECKILYREEGVEVGRLETDGL